MYARGTMHHNYSLKNNRSLTDSRLTSLKIVKIKTEELFIPQPAYLVFQ